MIRVNLLPQKRRKAPSGQSELWLVISLVLVALEVVGCLVLYGSKQDDLEQQRAKNKALEAQIAQIKDVAKNHEDVKKKLAALRDREDAIAKLQSARTGPTAMLLEVARLEQTKSLGKTIFSHVGVARRLGSSHRPWFRRCGVPWQSFRPPRRWAGYFSAPNEAFGFRRWR